MTGTQSSLASNIATSAVVSAINVLGGCCGTDHRHIEQICIHCLEAG
ncbi:homocysteine S-methyltransferase family protein [Mesorhizobium sp. BHbdii]